MGFHRTTGVLMTASTLNPDQEIALDKLIAFATKSNERFFILEGPAGVGKTYLLNHFSQAVKDYFAAVQFLTGATETQEMCPIIPTATTNTAAEKLLIADTPASTIHSFLELIIRTDYNTGQTHLLPRPRSAGPIHEPFLIIVDEASYIDDALLRYMETRTHKDTKFILMGDDCQLVSPKTNVAPAFTKGYQIHSLNTQVRQDPNSALAALCLNLRQSVKSNTIVPFDLVPGQIEHVADHSQWLNLAGVEMTDPSWIATESRILAWRNKTVNYYNGLITSAIKGDPIPYSGQYMISNRPVFLPNGHQTVSNNGLVLIKDVVPTNDLAFPGYEITYIFRNTYYRGFMPAEHGAYNVLKKDGLEEQKTHWVKKAMEEWLDFRPAYASTVDKAQGSTYDRVFVNLSDIAACNNYNRVLRMVYTAVSRAKSTVYFHGDLNGKRR